MSISYFKWTKFSTDKVTGWKDPAICCLQQTHSSLKDTQRLKVKEWEKRFYANRNQKKASVAKFILDKTDFKTNIVTGDTDTDKGINSSREYNISKFLCS